MSTDDVAFVRAILAAASLNGEGISRDAVERIYYADMAVRENVEPAAASEKWIDYYIERLTSIPFHSTGWSLPLVPMQS